MPNFAAMTQQELWRRAAAELGAVLHNWHGSELQDIGQALRCFAEAAYREAKTKAEEK